MRDNLGRFIKGFNNSPFKKNRIERFCNVCGKKFETTPL